MYTVVVSRMRSCDLKILGLMLKELITSTDRQIINGFFLQHANAWRNYLTDLINFSGR